MPPVPFPGPRHLAVQGQWSRPHLLTDIDARERPVQLRACAKHPLEVL
jgi:hypothetical protein